jgi:hypothetical protein
MLGIDIAVRLKDLPFPEDPKSIPSRTEQHDQMAWKTSLKHKDQLMKLGNFTEML